uniref:TIR domain-containing protein n=1 Tax=Palpitomonas bilix TaxID=652834 RepID=A0A7S3GET2_9EUKA|mmetsp:Transcript_46251/g.119189  ORF Transcript_46251/g.119189 Transcript_46251/m.119189 type:complete len:593 (+) Transcript_46251:189-1967(+)
MAAAQTDMSKKCAEALKQQGQALKPGVPPKEKEKLLKSAFSTFVKLAPKELEAKYRVGICYKHGYGVQKDDKIAFENFFPAASAGHLKAAGLVGTCYYNGLGVEKNFKEAFKWLNIAVPENLPFVNHCLGICYRYGHGTQKNDVEAARLFSIAASQGNQHAAHQLGLCLKSGEGVPLNAEEAFKWFDFAAKKGYPAAFFMVGTCYRDGVGVPQNLQAADIVFRDGASRGNLACEHALGVLLRTAGRDPEAFQVFLSAGTKGNIHSQLMVALCLREGRGVGRNPANAREWLVTAAKNGQRTAAHTLALWDLRGVGGPKNEVSALNWFLMAAEKGHPDAAVKAAELVEKRVGVSPGESDEQVEKRALELYKKAAELGHPSAFVALHRLQGQPVPTFEASAPILGLELEGGSGNGGSEGGLPSAIPTAPVAYQNHAVPPPSVVPPQSVIPPPAGSVFISHGNSEAAKQAAHNLGTLLRQAGVEVFTTDTFAGIPSLEWGQRLVNVISSSSVFVALVDDSFVASVHAFNETNIASAARKRLIAAQLDEAFKWDDMVVKSDMAGALSYALGPSQWVSIAGGNVSPLADTVMAARQAQ